MSSFGWNTYGFAIPHSTFVYESWFARKQHIAHSPRLTHTRLHTQSARAREIPKLCRCMCLLCSHIQSELYKRNSNKDFEICVQPLGIQNIRTTRSTTSYICTKEKWTKKKRKQTYVHRTNCSESTWHSYTISHRIAIQMTYLFIQRFCRVLVVKTESAHCIKSTHHHHRPRTFTVLQSSCTCTGFMHEYTDDSVARFNAKL